MSDLNVPGRGRSRWHVRYRPPGRDSGGAHVTGFPGVADQMLLGQACGEGKGRCDVSLSQDQAICPDNFYHGHQPRGLHTYAQSRLKEGCQVDLSNKSLF